MAGFDDLFGFDFNLDPLVDLDGSALDFSAPMFQYDVSGGMPSDLQLTMLDAMASPDTADAISRAQFDVSGGGAPSSGDLLSIYSGMGGQPTSLADLNVQGDAVGPARGSSSNPLKDALSRLARAAGGALGGGSGGGMNLSMPQFNATPSAEKIGMHPVTPAAQGQIPAPPAPPSEFRPMTMNTQPPDTGGLARLLAALRGGG